MSRLDENQRLRAIGMLQARLAQYGDDLDNLATLETADVQVVPVEQSACLSIIMTIASLQM
jgi:hypothetical protein